MPAPLPPDAESVACRRRRRTRRIGPRPTLARDITLVLIFKAAGLVLLYFAFFGPPHRVPADAGRVAQVLLSHAPMTRSD